MGFVKEFRDFAMRGNVMDLAIGVIIGGAFNNIVKALVGCCHYANYRHGNR